MSSYISATDLTLAMSSAMLVDLTDDDLDTVADAAVVASLIERASSIADTALENAGYAIPVSGADVTPALKLHVTFQAMALAGSRRPQYRDAGGYPVYYREGERARVYFDQLAQQQVLLENAPPPQPQVRVISGLAQQAINSQTRRGW